MAGLVEYDTLFRYLHVLSGIVWIGLLYFFNLVNLPLFDFRLKQPSEVNMAEKANAHVTLKALFWFRWGAVFTLLFGLVLAWNRMEGTADGTLAQTFEGADGQLLLGGVLLALVMFFNVWFIIWPSQKTILGNNLRIGKGVADDEKTKLEAQNKPLVVRAKFASRMNTWLSIPMLFGMVFGAHATSDADGSGTIELADYYVPMAILAVVIVIMVILSNRKPKL